MNVVELAPRGRTVMRPIRQTQPPRAHANPNTPPPAVSRRVGPATAIGPIAAALTPPVAPTNARAGLLPVSGAAPINTLAPAAIVGQLKIKDAVTLSARWAPILAAAMRADKLYLHELTPAQLNRLSAQNFADLMRALLDAHVNVSWHVTNPNRRLAKYPTHAKLTGLSALTLHMFVVQAPSMSIRIINTYPAQVVEELAERVPELFTLKIVVPVFRDVITLITQDEVNWDDSEGKLSNAAGSIIQAFLTQHCREKPELIEAWIVALMVQLEGAGFSINSDDEKTNSAKLGVLAGAVLAGALKYCRVIKEYGEKRYYFIDKATLFTVAATQFAGLGTVATGLIAVGAVLIGVMLERFYPIKDLNGFINCFEGTLRMRLLKGRIYQNKYDVSLLMHWLHATILCNGFR